MSKVLKTTLAGLFAITLLSACEEDSGGTDGDLAVYRGPDAAESHFMPSMTDHVAKQGAGAAHEHTSYEKRQEENNSLAYRHHTQVETEAGKVADLIGSVARTCNSYPGCVVLERGSIQYDEAHASGNFRARATPEAVKKLDNALRTSGYKVHVRSRQTTAEDMAGPITDLERRLSMLKRQRGQLEELQEQAGNNVEHLLRIVQQLSSVQSNIESLEGHRENLRQQVEKEVWTLTVQSSPTVSSSMKPVKDTIKEIPEILASTTAMLISFVFYTVPWVLVGGLLLSVARRYRFGRIKRNKTPDAMKPPAVTERNLPQRPV